MAFSFKTLEKPMPTGTLEWAAPVRYAVINLKTGGDTLIGQGRYMQKHVLINMCNVLVTSCDGNCSHACISMPTSIRCTASKHRVQAPGRQKPKTSAKNDLKGKSAQNDLGPHQSIGLLKIRAFLIFSCKIHG